MNAKEMEAWRVFGVAVIAADRDLEKALNSRHILQRLPAWPDHRATLHEAREIRDKALAEAEQNAMNTGA